MSRQATIAASPAEQPAQATCDAYALPLAYLDSASAKHPQGAKMWGSMKHSFHLFIRREALQVECVTDLLRQDRHALI